MYVISYSSQPLNLQPKIYHPYITSLVFCREAWLLSEPTKALCRYGMLPEGGS